MDKVKGTCRPVSFSPLPPGREGCQKCHQDDDHANLLLCEGCNDEYHIYCLDPPLESVPDGDFYCENCKHMHRIEQQASNDNLLQLVSCLPPDYTRRFGEVVWAAGGVGFGWWPSVIYDPRLTVDGARKLSLKHLGKKHLVYFFGCTDAPFTVLQDSKLIPWEEGLIEGHDVGKTAKGNGKNRFRMFQHAMQAAMVENDKPIHIRLSWNNEDEIDGAGEPSPIPIPIPTPSPAISTTPKKPAQSSTSSNNNTPSAKGTKESSPKERKRKRSRSPRPSSTDPDDSSPNNYNSTTKSRINKKSQKVNKIRQETDENETNQPFFCKLFLVSDPQHLEDRSKIKSSQQKKNIGFVTLSCKVSCTFADARVSIGEQLDDDCLPAKGRWKFYVPNLGPVSKKQEKKLGAMLDLLTSADKDEDYGDGSTSNPLQIAIIPNSQK